MTTYKVIDLPIQRPVSKSMSSLFEEFNDRVDTDDLRIEVGTDAVRLKLNKVDVELVRNVVGQLISRPDQDIDELVTPLMAVLDAIEGVKSYGIQGGKRSYVGYNHERKVKDRAGKELRRGRHYYANDHAFPAVSNRPPHDYLNKIVVGDSLRVLEKLPNNCVDLVFTSPPYNFGLDYSDGRDDEKWDRYFEQLFAIFDECIRVLKFGGRIAVNVQPLFSDYIPSHHIISNYFMDKRLIWKGEIVWEKNNYNCKYTAWGSWKSPSSPYLKYTWEFVEVFCKGSLKATGDKVNADISAEEFKQWVNARWSIAPERQMDKYGHPAMFPEALAERVMKLFSFQGDFVLDPFVGVGTVPVVARRTGRNYLGIDVSAEYCETAERRLHETATLL